MKVTIELTPKQARELYLLAKQTEVCDMATPGEKRAYAKMQLAVMEATGKFLE